MYEYTMPGGIYWEGDDDHGDRTDIGLVECGTGEEGNPYTFELCITTGSGTYTLCSILRQDLWRLGKWLVLMAENDTRGNP